MKVLFNAAAIVQGGGVQVAAQLIQASQGLAGVDFEYILTQRLCDELANSGCLPDRALHMVEDSPARCRAVRERLLEIERLANPSAIFTVFGPAYVRFTAPHLEGVGDGWVTHSNRLAFSTLKFPLEWIKQFAMCVAKGFWFAQANAWVVEAECARRGLRRRFRCPLERIHVIPNTCADQYHAMTMSQTPPRSAASSVIRALVFSAPYAHKNLDIVPRVCDALRTRRPELKLRFVLTLPEDCAVWRNIRALSQKLNVGHMIENRGVVPLSDGPSLYRECDFVFLPTLLETFSATYPEAMAMRRPIITTDLPFSHNACGDAAVFYPAKSPVGAAERILGLLDDPQLRRELVKRGLRQLAKLPTPEQRLNGIVAILSGLATERQACSPTRGNGLSQRQKTRKSAA